MSGGASSYEMPMTARRRARCSATKSLRIGISALQGPQYGAQKLMTSGLPLNVARLTATPFAFFSTKSRRACSAGGSTLRSVKATTPKAAMSTKATPATRTRANDRMTTTLLHQPPWRRRRGRCPQHDTPSEGLAGLNRPAAAGTHFARQGADVPSWWRRLAARPRRRTLVQQCKMRRIARIWFRAPSRSIYAASAVARGSDPSRPGDVRRRRPDSRRASGADALRAVLWQAPPPLRHVRLAHL